MRSRRRRIVKGLAVTLGGGFLAVGPGAGCLNYVVDTTLRAADFSFIFDCDGAGGGTLDLGTFLVDCSTE